jgi:tetratricopeptide (TPR) repeat protein
MRNRARWQIVFVVVTLNSAESLAAQDHPHATVSAVPASAVHFATSCRPVATSEFDRAVTLLHSFEFRESIRSFSAVLAADSTCAMAQWGIALSRWTNPMASGQRTAAILEPGRQAAVRASRLGVTATDRERGYIAAVNQLYVDYEHRDQRSRVVAYEQAMATLAAQQPADTEAQIFHALALVAAAVPTDKTYANQREAGRILEALWAKQPNHPGLAHYIIHTYDYPALAAQAMAAANRYAAIAPTAAHALHMPSHTFTRIGLWQQSVNTNQRSITVAIHEAEIAEALHASDYAVYAYLQMRRDNAAHRVLMGLPTLSARFDPNTITGAAPGSAGVFALAAIPARYALERGDWAEAAALQAHTTAYPYADALTYFARALGASRTNNLPVAHASMDSLAAIRERLIASGDAYWAEQSAIQRLSAQAWIDLAEGRRDDAVTHMREAAAKEDATEKSAITPGPLAPARELLGTMYLQLGRPAEALAEYQQTLTKEPNRFRALHGAMLSATAAGDRPLASQYAAQIVKLTGSTAYTRR